MTVVVTLKTELLPEDADKTVTKRRLADRVNRLNFLCEEVLVEFIHPKYGHSISVTGHVEPCDGERVKILWGGDLPDNISQYRPKGVVLPGPSSAFFIALEDTKITPKLIECRLPTRGAALPERKFTRLKVLPGIKAQVSQNGVRNEGLLIDFSALSLCVQFEISKPTTRFWIATDRPVHLSLEKNDEVIFSGDMDIVRSTQGVDQQTFVLAPRDMNAPRFAKKDYRPNRICLFPEPSLSFVHPLTGRQNELNIFNLSGLGMCVEEYPEQAMLLPGMILPAVKIKVGTGIHIPCCGQVVYRSEPTNENNHEAGARCGVALLDIDIQDHLRLLSILQRAKNRNAHLSTEVDVDTLWEFFFEVGFIYPSKYMQLAQRKEGFLETFRRTYLEQTPIARHFTFHVDGQIQSHLSAVRLYEQTWFQQHHAARVSGKKALGFETIRQLAEYFYSAYFLSHDKIGFVAGVYRPENRFPARYFREIVKHLDNPKAASIDVFSYLSEVPDLEDGWDWAQMPPDWEMARTTRSDLIELAGFYEQASGGCLIDALDLREGMLGRTQLEREYKKLGMVRRRHLYSIKRNHELAAVIEVHESDTGLSLSRMDRVVMAYVLNSELPPGLLTVLVKGLSNKFLLDNPPMMIFPQEYAGNKGLNPDKCYEMMILNVFHGEEYMKFLDEFIEKSKALKR